jgi:hypothetical protein
LVNEIDHKKGASITLRPSNSFTHLTWCWWICLTGA